MSKKQFKKTSGKKEIQLIPISKDLNSFYRWEGETLVLNILGTPSSKRNAIGKVRGAQLKVSVKEVPEGGKATDCMVRFLAGEFDVPIKDIEVVFGRFNVNKQ